jgi:hypothetical protein
MEPERTSVLSPTIEKLLARPQDKTLQGSVLVLIQFDVCEEIRLDALRDIFGARRQEASFKHAAPGYVRYERPPVVERIEPLVLELASVSTQIKYYDYGVLSVVFERFSGDWDTPRRLASRWVWDTDFASLSQKIAKQKLERARPALVKPYDDWLNEDYFIFHVREIAGNPSASELLAAEGGRIAQIVRGENCSLSDGERHEILQSKNSYYPNDLISWNAAFLYDTAAGAEPSFSTSNTPTRSCLSSATTAVLTLSCRAYTARGERSTGVLTRWHCARDPPHRHLDVDEHRARQQCHQISE